MFRDRYPRGSDKVAFNLSSLYEDKFSPYRGELILEIHDEETGKLLYSLHKKNVVTRDASIHVSRLIKDNSEPNFGALMLAVGTGAAGSGSTPNAPDERQRKLNTEIARKLFSSTTFRTEAGVAVAYPTRIVDFTTQFVSGEAVGPLNEMGIISPISSNPLTLNPNPNAFPTYDDTLDISVFDVLLNYLTFPTITKPSASVLTLTWRLTF